MLVRSLQAEIIIVKRLNQGRNSVTRVRVEPRSCDQDRRKIDVFIPAATQPPSSVIHGAIFFYNYNSNCILFTEFPWPGDSEGIFDLQVKLPSIAHLFSVTTLDEDFTWSL